MREQRVVLEHHPDLAAVRRARCHVHAVHLDRAPVRCLEPRDQVQDGRLAAAGRPEEGHELARLDLERETVHGRDRVEALGEIGQQEASAGARGRRPRLSTPRPTAMLGARRRRPARPTAPSPGRSVAASLATTPRSAQRDDHLERRDGGQERIELVLRDRAPHLARQRRRGRAADEERDHDLVEGDDRREERAGQHAAAHQRQGHPQERLPRRGAEAPGRALEPRDRGREPPPRRSAPRRGRPASRGQAPARRACRPGPPPRSPRRARSATSTTGTMTGRRTTARTARRSPGAPRPRPSASPAGVPSSAASSAASAATTRLVPRRLAPLAVGQRPPVPLERQRIAAGRRARSSATATSGRGPGWAAGGRRGSARPRPRSPGETPRQRLPAPTSASSRSARWAGTSATSVAASSTRPRADGEAASPGSGSREPRSASRASSPSRLRGAPA